MDKEYKDISFEIKADDVDSDSGIFKGYGSTFGGKPDSYGDVIAKGAFKESLEKGGRNGTGVAMLWQHKSDNPIGVWLELVEDEKGLKAVGKLTKGVQKADEALLLLKAGAIKGLSIGFQTKEYEILNANDDKKRHRVLKQIDLWEISPVTFPANTRARITSVKALEEAKNERDLERALREAGLSINESKLIVSRCKPYLREIRNQNSLSILASELEKVNLQNKIKNTLKW